MVQDVAAYAMKFLVATVLAVAVAIPIILELTAEADVSGTTLTVLGLVPLLVALLLIVAIAGNVRARVS
jgi:hypothetical protein